VIIEIVIFFGIVFRLQSHGMRLHKVMQMDVTFQRNMLSPSVFFSPSPNCLECGDIVFL